MTGGFSRAIDLIQSEYGWRDREILEMPICRVRQMIEVISQRQRDLAKFQIQITEWQTKNISAMFIGLAENQKQAKNMQKIVEKMRLPLADEQADIIDSRPFEDVVEQGAKVDLQNQPSFEALSAAMARM